MGRWKLSMRVSMFNQNYAFNVFSTCFQKNMGPNAQTWKGSKNKIQKHKGSGGVNIQKQPFSYNFFSSDFKIVFGE